MGAVHLLLHGVWAFKIDAKGEKTELVFGNPISLGSAERTAPAAIVLTEWKTAHSQREANSQLEVAKKQANLYSRGALSDLELLNTRFLVVVTEKNIDLPPDVLDGNIRYKHISVAVNPDVPSVAVKNKPK